MKLKNHTEATAFVKALLKMRKEGGGNVQGGGRELPGLAKLDSIPAWNKEKTPPKLDGSEIEAVYLSYLEATEEQKEQTLPARMAGCKLERISGRLVDVRECADGTCQVLFTNGLRDAGGAIPYRGPNVDKGILCALSIGEGLGENVDEILARVPQEMVEKLKAGKAAQAAKKVRTASVKVPAEAPGDIEVEVTVKVSVPGNVPVIKVPSAPAEAPATTRVKLK